VHEQAVPYPRPQETGNKEGVDWLTLTDRTGAGLLVVSEGKPISASAIPYSMEELDAAQHTYELDQSPAVFLSLDARMMGLGNSSCGPGVLEKYSVPPITYDLHLRLQPLTAGDNARDFLSRHYSR
jgi:beta-galactosidase